jgi:hypothetical protein
MDVLEKLLFNLQTIASIPKGKRISTAKEFIIIDEDSVLQPVLRWRAGDTRDKAVQAICREVRTTIKLSEYIMESRYIYLENDTPTITDNCDIAVTVVRPISKRDERINEVKRIRSNLSEANYGIDNICETYCDDANVLAYLKPLIGEISDHVSKITKLLIELGEYTEPRDLSRNRK